MYRFAFLLALFTATFVSVGCERDVMEAETPGGAELEVEENVATDELEVEVEE